MALSSRSRRSAGPDIWPGFVDALATLLMVIMFVLTVFVLGQFLLTDLLSGRDQALARLENQVSQLAELLSLERQASADLRLSLSQLSDQLQASTAERDRLALRLNEATGRADEADRLAKELADAFQTIEADRATIETSLAEIASLQRQIEALQAQREKLAGELATKTGETEKASAELVAAQAQVALLNDQIAALRQQMARIEQALEASEAKAKEQNVQIADLGKRLNLALAGKVEELARYRSEFFGRLREVLGNRPDIRVVGDRFVFQSEVLFPSGSAELTPQGREQIVGLATTLRELAAKIPDNINWLLRVDGHTDVIPIATAQFPSNWELSSARATSVVKLLIEQGIAPERLAAAGFGEFQPLEASATSEGRARNRRIELKLDQR